MTLNDWENELKAWLEMGLELLKAKMEMPESTPLMKQEMLPLPEQAEDKKPSDISGWPDALAMEAEDLMKHMNVSNPSVHKWMDVFHVRYTKQGRKKIYYVPVALMDELKNTNALKGYSTQRLCYMTGSTEDVIYKRLKRLNWPCHLKGHVKIWYFTSAQLDDFMESLKSE